MNEKDVVINQLKLCAHYYEEKLIELMGNEEFLNFSRDCTAWLLSKEAHEYIYGDNYILPSIYNK